MSRPIDGEGTLRTSTAALALGVPPITPTSPGSNAATAIAADRRRIHLLGAWCETFIAFHRAPRTLSYTAMGGQSNRPEPKGASEMRAKVGDYLVVKGTTV